MRVFQALSTGSNPVARLGCLALRRRWSGHQVSHGKDRNGLPVSRSVASVAARTLAQAVVLALR